MSIFKDILNKLLHKSQAQKPQAGAPPAAAGSAQTSPDGNAPPAAAAPVASPVPAGGSAPSTGSRPLSQVDVEAVMDKAASEAGQPLNWRTSIVDTMKALGIDSSLEHRKALAKELDYTGDMNDSAALNIWLQKRLMQELAANGGRLPKDLTD